MAAENTIESSIGKISDRLFDVNLLYMVTAGKRLKNISEIDDLNSYLYSADYLDDTGKDLRQINRALNTAHKMNIHDMNSLFKGVTAEVYSTGQEMAEHKSTRLSPLTSYRQEASPLLRQAMNSYEVMAKSTTVNSDYKKTIRQYVNRLTMGGEDNAPTALRKAVRELAEQGIATIDYKSGRHVRMDTAVRRDLMAEYGEIARQVQSKLGEELDAEAVELTIEFACAWDHQDAQGHVFLNEEFEKLQNFEVAKDIDGNEIQLGAQRRIGEYNCRHAAIPFLVGISERSVSQEDLDSVNQSNKDGIEWGGERITIYKATQIQRGLETEMRHQKEYLNLYREVRSTRPELESDYQRTKRNLADLRSEYHALGDKLKPMAIREKLDRASIPKGSTGNKKLPD